MAIASGVDAHPPQPAFIGGGRMVVQRDWAPLRHSHPFCEMMVVYSGSLKVEIGDQPCLAAAGEILLYPPEAAHLERVSGHGPAEFIFFSVSTPPRSTKLVTRDARGRMRLLAGWLIEEARSSHAMKQAVVDSLLQALVLEFDLISTAATPGMAEQVRLFLRESLAKQLTVDDLASVAHMSRAHFIRSYKQLTGITPMAELRQLRVQEAKNLVITTDLPLKTIALRVGLQDEHHLSHVFRRLLGVAPGHFRTIRPKK